MISIKLKGKNKCETAENYSILLIMVGATVLSLGIGLSAASYKGLSAILAMLGSFISFIFTIVLVIVWLMQGTQKEGTVGETNG